MYSIWGFWRRETDALFIRNAFSYIFTLGIFILAYIMIKLVQRILLKKRKRQEEA
jgi:hypothetical protein